MMKAILVALVVAVAFGAWLVLRKPATTVAGGAGPAAVLPAPAQPRYSGPTGSGITPHSQLPTGAQPILPPAVAVPAPMRPPSNDPIPAGPLAESRSK